MSVLLLGLFVKLFGLVERLHKEIMVTSQLNRNAVLAQELLKNQIKNSQGNIEILDNGHKLKINQDIFYVDHNNLYIKKPGDKAVELIAGVKNFNIIRVDDNKVKINFMVYPKEGWYETQRVYFNNSISLNFSVQFDHAV